MSYDELLAALDGLGLRLEVKNGSKISVAGTPGALTPQIRGAIAEHKPCLLARLMAEQEEARAERCAIQGEGSLLPHKPRDTIAEIPAPDPGHHPTTPQTAWFCDRLACGPVGAIAAVWMTESHCGRQVSFDTDQSRARFVARARVWTQILLDRLDGSVRRLHPDGAWYFCVPGNPWPPRQVDQDVAEGHAALLPNLNRDLV